MAFLIPEGESAIEKQLKPPFAYYGGKTTLAPRIAALFPPHKHYIEPFAGSLAVLLAKDPAPQETVNDLDSKLVTFWRVLRDRPDELWRACALTPHAREELALAKQDTDDEVEQARRVWVVLAQSRSHTVKATGWWQRIAHNPHTPPQYLASYTDRMADVATRLRGVSLENRDGIEMIRAYGKHDGNLLYLDPPYLGSTRAANYQHEMLTDEEHTRFAEAVNECSAAVVISGYDSPLYESLFHGWHVTRLRGATTLSGATGRTEMLWSNVPLTERKHDE